jgi:hypothetical protein
MNPPISAVIIISAACGANVGSTLKQYKQTAHLSDQKADCRRVNAARLLKILPSGVLPPAAATIFISITQMSRLSSTLSVALVVGANSEPGTLCSWIAH